MAKEQVMGEVISWTKTILLALLLAFAIDSFVIVNATVPTGSMENTIMPHDRIVAFRLSYLWGSPKRGDVAVFRYPDNEEILYVKRIIGLPGDTVEVRDGSVYINGSTTPLNEPYLKEIPVGSFGPYEVPVGSYFMMGDNRNNSLDSRYWSTTKYVSEDKILGKVIFKYYPDFRILQGG